MIEHLGVLVIANSISEYLLAQQKHHLVRSNDHTTAVRQRAMRVAEITNDLLDQCNYKPLLFVNDYYGNELRSTPVQTQPLFKRGDVYFSSAFGGRIIFAPNGDLSSADLLEANSDILNFQSGRFEDNEAFNFFIEEISPALEAVKSYLNP
ncbi:hypothetical protein AABV68_001283 [Enterobacter ludwigii]|uniref:hypothetical protein n=1 Tax=Enterobacter bugandensis TaxID=881260 RepID=UPI001C999A9A|nr:hypothetical protein [Enterobacter bugandensis]MBY6289481.1 hypothetical protein [Enterobacter bugandensis]MCK6903415.1 hypothetical protein [Enterobacter roggenkampii]MDX7624543.1 hypothetical protein [Enterobacter bugandensis]